MLRLYEKASACCRNTNLQLLQLLRSSSAISNESPLMGDLVIRQCLNFVRSRLYACVNYIHVSR